MGLEQIAQMMYSRAARTGVAYKQLSGGLLLALRIRPAPDGESKTRHSLSLARRDVMPGSKEEAICRRYFRVPDDCQVDRPGGSQYRVLRLTWWVDPPAGPEQRPEQFALDLYKP